MGVSCMFHHQLYIHQQRNLPLSPGLTQKRDKHDTPEESEKCIPSTSSIIITGDESDAPTKKIGRLDSGEFLFLLSAPSTHNNSDPDPSSFTLSFITFHLESEPSPMLKATVVTTNIIVQPSTQMLRYIIIHTHLIRLFSSIPLSIYLSLSYINRRIDTFDLFIHHHLSFLLLINHSCTHNKHKTQIISGDSIGLLRCQSHSVFPITSTSVDEGVRNTIHRLFAHRLLPTFTPVAFLHTYTLAECIPPSAVQKQNKNTKNVPPPKGKKAKGGTAGGGVAYEDEEENDDGSAGNTTGMPGSIGTTIVAVAKRLADGRIEQPALVDVHYALDPTPNCDGLLREKEEYTCALVNGSYLYYHYNQEGVRDGGWGCAFRSLQTLASWCLLRGIRPLPNVIPPSLSYAASADRPTTITTLPVGTQLAGRLAPTIADILDVLVDIGDKPADFATQRSPWIGSVEVGLILDTWLGV